ncbi:hypothetical protein Tco_0292440 [Tanacetum coccineum]
MVLDNDGVGSKTIKEKLKSLALKAKVTREQTSNDTDSQDGSDEDVDEEEEAEAFNLLARNFRKFFWKGNRFGKGRGTDIQKESQKRPNQSTGWKRQSQSKAKVSQSQKSDT